MRHRRLPHGCRIRLLCCIIRVWFTGQVCLPAYPRIYNPRQRNSRIRIPFHFASGAVVCGLGVSREHDMYAVIETGGKQYRVAPGETVQVETLTGEPGDTVEFDRVLAVVDDSNALFVGGDLAKARVRGTIVEHGRGDKVIVFKFKRKKQYKRTIGHRQNYTAVRVDEFVEQAG